MHSFPVPAPAYSLIVLTGKRADTPHIGRVVVVRIAIGVGIREVIAVLISTYPLILS